MAAELVGGAILSASISVLFERIASQKVLDYLQKKSKGRDFDEMLGKLKLLLNSVAAVLDDAKQKQMKNRRVEAWLNELEDVFYEADDLMDEIETDALHMKVEAESPNSPSEKPYFSFIYRRHSNHMNLQSKVEKPAYLSLNDRVLKTKIEKILAKLEYIVKQKDVLNLKEDGCKWGQSQRLPSTSLLEESEVYGRDEDKDAIIRLLLSDDSERMSVIPIVGLGGIEKTTLAQAIFNDDKVCDHFELKAWVCVSEEFDVSRVITSVLVAIKGVARNNDMDLNSLQLELKEKLSGKKFLIVLDDVWNENYVNWEVLKMPFKYGAQGSKIIVTTRSEKVASIMRTVPIHHLKELTNEACWQLFAKHASGNGDFTTEPDLQKIGKEIVLKCKGLPLAAKTLGGLLRSTIDVGQWERILKSEIWDVTDEESNILPALRLSYHYLPSHLKRCFAYCSVFPKGYKFQKDDMILLWMAENLLEHTKRTKSLEEVGGEYFSDLVCRSIFQRSRADNGLCFVMHDHMVDLAKFVSGNYFVHLESESSDKIPMNQARHLAYVTEPHEHYKRFKSIFEATHLRTFLPLDLQSLSKCSISNSVLPELLLKLQCLRVLSLCGYETIKELPDSVGQLKHLRYLDLSHTSIECLPECVSMLYNLQTLKLCHCRNLRKLFSDFHGLTNLRYLDVKGSDFLIEMPKEISKLKNLQILSTFIVGKWEGTKIGELGKLSNLRGKLSIEKLDNIVKPADALEAKLSDKKYIEEIELEWKAATIDPQHEMDVLHNLQPNPILKKLRVKNYGGIRFPDWLSDQSFYNITDLYLENCEYCGILPPLGKLSSLKTLQIRNFPYVLTVGPEFYGESSSSVKPFASLEYLRFFLLSNWEKWAMPVGDADVFPKLKELTIVGCRQLTGDLPRFLPSLEKLIIDGCRMLASSLPRMPIASNLELSDCDDLIRFNGCHVIESFECLQQ